MAKHYQSQPHPWHSFSITDNQPQIMFIKKHKKKKKDNSPRLMVL
jgi:hypothetical protein